jgi:hypothetical protein
MLFFAKLPGARLWTLATVLASAAILWNTAIYFDGSPRPRFLFEKGEWAYQPWWLAAFYFHIIGACTCMASGTPLMFEAFTRRYPHWHRWLGYVYINAVLWMAAPAGLALSLVAKGGALGAAGFAVSGALWWYVTWDGYRAIRRRDLPTHIRQMVRSFALALSAPAFRVLQAGLFFLGVPDEPNYILSLWLSVAVSAVLSESYLLRSGRIRWPRSFSRFFSLAPASGVRS